MDFGLCTLEAVAHVIELAPVAQRYRDAATATTTDLYRASVIGACALHCCEWRPAGETALPDTLTFLVWARQTTRRVFNAVDVDGDGAVSAQDLVRTLHASGLTAQDPRLKQFFASLGDVGTRDRQLTLPEFHDALSTCSTLVYKCLMGKLRVPSFAEFADIIGQVFKEVGALSSIALVFMHLVFWPLLLTSAGVRCVLPS